MRVLNVNLRICLAIRNVFRGVRHTCLSDDFGVATVTLIDSLVRVVEEGLAVAE